MSLVSMISLGAVVIGSVVPSGLNLCFNASFHQVYYPAKMCDHVNAIFDKVERGEGCKTVWCL